MDRIKRRLVRVAIPYTKLVFFSNMVAVYTEKGNAFLRKSDIKDTINQHIIVEMVSKVRRK